MHHLNWIALSIGGFLFFIGLEYLVSRRTGKNYFQFAESVANLNVGIAERLLDIFVTGLFYFFFDYIYRNFAIWDIQPNWLTWFLLFLATDFVWYWYHRLAHEVNILWAAHVVHHQSEDFNYTVSARITVFQAAARSLFWAILPLMGFPPAMITALLLVHGLYPFFIHTQTIGRLGILEYFMVTPSHHRVHHSSNEKYLDKNYGDVLIIWDKMFGTFVKEDHKEPCVYGLTSPLKSHSFLWQQFHFMLELGTAFRRAKDWKQKWNVLFGKPDDIDPAIRGQLEEFWLRKTVTRKQTKGQRIYIVIQTAVSISLLFAATLLEAYIPPGLALFIVLFILISLVNTGAILEQKKWFFYLEYARMMLLAVTSMVYFQHLYVFVSVLFFAALVTFYFSRIERSFKRWLFQRIQ
ncbi:sterol desaturase family protein [Chitinophaga sp. GCM10012297]|uniref:Sterol desaturase family protein n=1 Tax=Chitinophaga chungangae TaxID=2821488 RepID=A0ABS3YIM7_9BACT|nr:sterol desaturase family protein [Chitinophaga chungangae]MBO9153939.1 sterol desaturase family protein [Chitinophaga chungangae]